MPRTTTCRFARRLVLGILLLAPAPVRALTEAEVNAALERVQDLRQRDGLTPAEAAQQIGEWARGLDLSTASIEQLERIGPLFLWETDTREALLQRLADLRRRPDSAGARAGTLYAMVVSREGESADLNRAVAAALAHPGVGELVEDGTAGDLLQALGRLPEGAVRDNADGILALAGRLSPSMHPLAIAAAAPYAGLLHRLGDAVAPAERRVAHDRLVAIFRAGRERALDAGNAPLARRIADELKYLDSPYGRGELIGHPAPELHFDWVSDDPGPASLSDLRGKVVVLDFWATWCRPCVASFPPLRALRAHYPPSKVALIGVTSLQGRHVPGRGRPIDTASDPDQEYRLMRTYIRQQDITWTVAFSRASLFDPAFGVRAIPHLSVVDAHGVVRHNGLHPMMPIDEKIRLIDALLAEAEAPGRQAAQVAGD